MGERSKDKKRKRAEEGSSRPKKKNSSQNAAPAPAPTQPQALASTPSAPIKVASVRTDNSCPPIIATTPGLCIPQSLQFQTYTKPQPSGRSKKSQPSDIVLHTSDHSKLDYTGKEEGPGGRESHLKHYIGVFDPATNQLSVIEAKKMAVRGLVRSQLPSEEAMKEPVPDKTMFELRNDLGHAFGTKKAKKALAAVTENAIAPEQAVNEAGGDPQKLSATSRAVMQSISQVTGDMASREELQAASADAKPVPPGDYSAEEIGNVYRPEVLIGSEILNAIPIKDWQEAIKKKANSQTTNAFIASRLMDIGEGPNSAQRLKILRYLDFLLKFQKAPRIGKERETRRLPPKDKLRQALDPAPEVVVENIRRKFSNKGEMRKFHTELVYTYCCALAAILCNFAFDPARLRFDLGLDEKQFAQYFKEIGGRIKSVPGEKGARRQHAQLSIPLEFPKVRFQRQRK